LDTNQLTQLLGSEGPEKGSQNAIYCGAYIFFEKLRTKREGEKTPEKIWKGEKWEEEEVERNV
jgi:hypothetical protein